MFKTIAMLLIGLLSSTPSAAHSVPQTSIQSGILTCPFQNAWIVSPDDVAQLLVERSLARVVAGTEFPIIADHLVGLTPAIEAYIRAEALPVATWQDQRFLLPNGKVAVLRTYRLLGIGRILSERGLICGGRTLRRLEEKSEGRVL